MQEIMNELTPYLLGGIGGAFLTGAVLNITSYLDTRDRLRSGTAVTELENYINNTNFVRSAMEGFG